MTSQFLYKRALSFFILKKEKLTQTATNHAKTAM